MPGPDWLRGLSYICRQKCGTHETTAHYPNVYQRQSKSLSSSVIFSDTKVVYQPIVTGRGGVGNVRAAPLKLDVTKISHPQTASILAQHEAANIEYEKLVMKRNREIKAITPVSLVFTLFSLFFFKKIPTCFISKRVSGRGGIGNITESHPGSPRKPVRRASFFKGGGAGTSPQSPKGEVLDMNVFGGAQHKKYAHSDRSVCPPTVVALHLANLHHSWRRPRTSSTTLSGPGSGGNSPLSPDSEFSGSDKASASSVSIRTMSSSNFALSEPSSPSIPESPSKEKHSVSALWSKVVRSKSRSRRPPDTKQQDLFARVEMAASTSPQLPNDHYHINNFPDFVGDPIEELELPIGYAI